MNTYQVGKLPEGLTVTNVLMTLDDGLVACPICLQRMKIEAVDRHISTGSCPGEPQAQSQLRAPISNGSSSRNNQSHFLSSSKPNRQHPPRALEPLPALNYSMLKDNALRKKLAELNLSTVGSRQQLEQRHKEWATIWNANCDSAHPKTRNELVRDIETWERTVSNAARPSSLYGGHAAQPQVKDKDFDGASWSTSNDSSFKDLIAKARQTKKQAEQKAREATAPEPAPEPAYAAQEPIGGKARHREPEFVSVPHRSQNQISGFDGTADSTIPVTNDGADPLQ
jgi:E3 ubiquitin-protein ligase RAD18